jgi:signal transduction histidine kinase
MSDAYLFVANPTGRPDLIMMTATAVIAAVAIAIRRHVPVNALALAAATTCTTLLISAEGLSPAPVVATMVTMYSVAATVPKPRAVVMTALVVVSLGVVLLFQVTFESMILMFVWLSIPCLSQRMVRAHRRQAEESHTLTTRAIRESDARTRLAILEERARVARELHDSVAHAVSVMVLQAGAAEQVMDTMPANAHAAIRAAADQGRQAHDDLRSLLGVLADDPTIPPPSLARLDTLLSQVAKAGLPVTLAVSGEPVELPTGLDASVYRVVQEGLTNALKHAGQVPTTVTLDYAPHALTIEVRDHGGNQPPQPLSRGGHGLLGMRERIEHYGGTLQTGPRAGGGFAVRACIPLDRAPS